MRIALLANLDLHSNYGVNLLRDALAGHEVALFLSETALEAKGFPVFDPAEYARFLRSWVPGSGG